MKRSRKRSYRLSVYARAGRSVRRLLRRAGFVVRSGRQTAARQAGGGVGLRIVWRRFLPTMVFAVMGIVSLSLLAGYGINSARRHQANKQLSSQFDGELVYIGEGAPPEGEVSSQPVALAAMPTVAPNAQPALRDTYRTLRGTPLEQMESLYRKNNDLVGWLYIRGVVSLPVVYRDNEYYLDHNFDQKKDAGGALFLDENHPLTEETQNLVIHGHNMYDSSMFGILSSFARPSAVRSHPFATFSTMYGQEDYVVFAVLRVDPDVNSSGYFCYIGQPTFVSEADFYDYTGELKRRSLIDLPIDVTPEDALLTLATCVGDDRLAVVYRRVREGESQQHLKALVGHPDE